MWELFIGYQRIILDLDKTELVELIGGFIQSLEVANKATSVID
jgi:hypothetical protein